MSWWDLRPKKDQKPKPPDIRIVDCIKCGRLVYQIQKPQKVISPAGFKHDCCNDCYQALIINLMAQGMTAKKEVERND